MTRRRAILLVLALLVGAAGWYFYAGSSTPEGQPPLAHLSAGNLSEFRSAFNAAAAGPRLLILLSPT
jgi:hypothetical protein